MPLSLNGTSGLSGVDGSAGTPALQGSDTNTGIHFGTDEINLDTGGSTRATVDSSGRLLVGPTSSSAQITALFQGNSGGSTSWGALNLARGTTSPTSGQSLGELSFSDSGHDIAGLIACQRDGGTWTSASSQPTRLVFSTTADGASTPTEQMRVSSDGNILMATTDSDPATNNVTGLSYNGFLGVSHTGTAIIANRIADGTVISIRSAGTTEGSISVSGTTVTYGGGHLARWSQLPNGEDPSDILKGTVMTNLDEMCEWGEEDNEQLNKTKVSDVEGDPNVAGVFVATSFDEEGPLDFFVGMTGDMVIRIAEGVTVERGDLLMSAGDGTAKPQDDDIIRSKTIAKVTSTNVSCTYADGSFCVPCVLMAC